MSFQRGIAETINLGNAINRDHPLNRGLVGHWLVLPGLTGGNRLRDLCGANHGTLTNGPKWSSARGRPGGKGSLSCDGANDYVSVADTNNLDIGTNDLTVAYWLSTTTTDQYAAQVTKATGFPGSLGTGYYCGNGGLAAGKHIHAIKGAANEFQLRTTTASNTGAWFHVAAVFVRSSAAASFACLNAKDDTASRVGTMPTDSIASAQSLEFMRRSGGGYTVGYLDDVRVYNRALSAGEIEQLYDESRRGYPTMLNRLSPLRTFYFGTGGAAATVRDMSQMHLGSVSFSHRNILQRGSIGVNS